MTESTALVSLADTMNLGKVLAQSGYFKDATDEAKAVVKVLAGAEMGFGPIASMTGVHIVQGKPTIGANLLGAAVKRHPRYDYHVDELSDDGCAITFYDNGKKAGTSSFSMTDAQAAGLANKPVWKQYKRNMLFSRAMSNGTRWYCPDVLDGVTPYTPEEFDAPVNAEGEIIDVTPEPVASDNRPNWSDVPESTPTNGTRPLSAELVRDVCRKKAKWQDGQRVDGEPITDGQVKTIPSLLEKATPNLDNHGKGKARHAVLAYLFGAPVKSTHNLTKLEASAVISWLKEEGDGWDVSQYAEAEVAAILKASAVEAGQQEMELEPA